MDRSVLTRRRMNGPVSRFSRSAASSSPCRCTGTAKLSRNFSAGPSSRAGELHDRPQFAQVVLDRGAGQREPGPGGQAAHRAGLPGARVLDVLRFVADHPLPRHRGQRLAIPGGSA